ncbi:N-acetylmuramoyl-L-alanine amidase [Streptococcus dysgalactiae]|uniref:N-acetylmuramoyl-L-alanine amidase n=1 Tax=Streptococcus dysgalactiae TaxID=1334 RepID=A0AAF0A0M0_STRDY|nr:N-acetylmuramoyl-L-alanine amidase [Streptococcus dysgalactiae]QGH05071.1 CHAP domain-containing protein [Streptococcus dysgalactiae subsp. dysgalactiae]WAI93244.1 amidase [Streptococcus dysgalactiae]WCE86341.1 N-acetylmuramoyl-L-alanine amidase [Streptococcus dysgalactiae]WCN26335.1 N-acetylmuramoyl-L-alanine amidase [Streptococcus dysgalactiae]
MTTGKVSDMATVDEVIADVDSFVGRCLDMDGYWGGQCMDVIERVASHFGKYLGGNAIDGLTNAQRLGWPVIMNVWGVNPKRGDVGVMSVPGHGFGHIFLVTKDSDGVTIETLEQNIDGYADNNKDGINDQLQVGGVVRRHKRDFTGVIGWFRPPYDTTKTGGKTMAIPTKTVNGDLFSGLVTDVDPNIMNGDYNRTKIDRIVIHHNAGTSDSAARRTWYISTGVGTSAHYQVTPDKIWGCVSETSVAYHAGDYAVNQRSIGIEHLNDAGAPHWTIAEETYHNSAKLIADICQRYNIPIDDKHIIPHRVVSATACPGGIDMAKLIRMAQEVASGAISKTEITVKPSGTFRVKISVSDLNIRKAPSVSSKSLGFIKAGVYTIVETKQADGYKWGKLKSGIGWIALNYTKKL